MEAKKPTRDVAMAWCICGRSDAIGGRTHTCRHPDGPRWSDAKPNKATKPATVTHVSDMANRDAHDLGVANGMANRSAKLAGLNRASPTYRYRNPTKRRIYMRDYMRKVRATEKTASPA